MSDINIVIADDHDMFRSGLAALMKGVFGFEVLGEAKNGEEAMTILENNQVDVLILDIEMPLLDGIDTCLKLIDRYPDLGILALSWHKDRGNVVNMVRSGARGYIIKDASPSELVAAIKAVAEGGSYFSKEVSSTLLGNLGNSKSNSIDGMQATPLTSRELEVLEFISNEFTNKEIADQLYISPRTVETHRRNLIHKLKVKNTVGLVKYYINFVQRITKKPA